jgi:lipopolysaccharide/colanic/teichoic acid biosynthesis glycosyltransferase
MIFGSKKATALLFLGDIAIFASSLWVTLLIRYQVIPSTRVINDHLPSFSFLFVIWLLVFYMAGLYGKRIIIFKNRISSTIIRVQLFNIVIAALFFFLVPGIGIAPKTNLILYLFVSLALIFVWRLWLFPRITRPASRALAAIVGSGTEVEELVMEVNGNPRYPIYFAYAIPAKAVADDFDGFASTLAGQKISLIVIDAQSDALRLLHTRLYDFAMRERRYELANLKELYEEVFDRVPLSLIEFDWYLQNLGSQHALFYSAGKRAIDIVGGLVMGIATVVVTPFIWIAMRMEGPGELFIAQNRIGMRGVPMTSYKFRSMRYNDAGSGAWVGEGRENYVTKLGAILRKTSLDEFPQFLNILQGTLSLVGPRNDTLGLGTRLAEAIKYYDIRYSVKPGITGWAQINQQYEQGNISPQSIEETKVRLAYDFYYIQNRSLLLDIVIALKTVKRMFFRVSSW